MAPVALLRTAAGAALSEDLTAITPTVARRLLAEHGLAPRKADGQNFVVDPNTVRRIVEASGVGPHDEVLEIGPGLCSLTLPLADVARRVVAVEIDAGLASLAGELTSGRPVVVHHADALQVDLDELVDGPARLVASLPYNVATPLLLHALDADRVQDAYVMVQREVGERWAATVGDAAYGAVSVKVALAGTSRIDLAVPRQVFLPVPNVDSVMVRVTRHDDALPRRRRRAVAEVVDAAFARRRKTLRNNLRAVYGDEGTAALEEADIDPGRRAETLAAPDFVRLTEALERLHGPPAEQA